VSAKRGIEKTDTSNTAGKPREDTEEPSGKRKTESEKGQRDGQGQIAAGDCKHVNGKKTNNKGGQKTRERRVEKFLRKKGSKIGQG